MAIPTKPGDSALPMLEFTQIPDRLFDYWLFHLTGSQFKVISYMARRIYGFRKEQDAISIDQICNGITTRKGVDLDLGTGLSREGAIQAIQHLVKVGLVIAEHVTVADKKVHGVNLYRINIKASLPQEDAPDKGVVNSVDHPGQEQNPPGGSQLSRLGVVNSVDQGVVNSVDLQDTVEQHTVLQQTVNNPPISPKQETQPIPVSPGGTDPGSDLSLDNKSRWMQDQFNGMCRRNVSPAKHKNQEKLDAVLERMGSDKFLDELQAFAEAGGRSLDDFSKQFRVAPKRLNHEAPARSGSFRRERPASWEGSGGRGVLPSLSAHIPREVSPPPAALLWNERVPTHKWEVWDSGLDDLWRTATANMNGKFESWLDRCAHLAPLAAKHEFGSGFTLKKALESWPKVLNGDWNWMEKSGKPSAADLGSGAKRLADEFRALAAQAKAKAAEES